MKTIKVPAIKVGDWSKKFLTLEDVNNVVDESAEIIGPDGKRAAMLLRGAVSQESIQRAWTHLKNYNPKSANRGTASGFSGHYVRKDGSKSKTNVGDIVNSGVIGFYDRYPRVPFCRKCAWNQQHPKEFAELLPLCREVNDAFRYHWFEKWEVQDLVRKQTHTERSINLAQKSGLLSSNLIRVGYGFRPMMVNPEIKKGFYFRLSPNLFVSTSGWKCGMVIYAHQAKKLAQDLGVW